MLTLPVSCSWMSKRCFRRKVTVDWCTDLLAVFSEVVVCVCLYVPCTIHCVYTYVCVCVCVCVCVFVCVLQVFQWPSLALYCKLMGTDALTSSNGGSIRQDKDLYPPPDSNVKLLVPTS